MRKLSIVAAIGVALTSSNLIAEEISGLITDERNRPLSDVTVKVRNQNITTKTNSKGEFVLNLGAGSYTLDVEAGQFTHFHQPILVKEGTNEKLAITLEEEPNHKIVVLANPMEHTTLDMATPAMILSGEELIQRKSITLGDVLEMEPGISVSSFGPAVSRPVIRGLAGSRVQITNNQMLVHDASTTSSDHDVGIEPLLAEQIEVLKGPASLLYGSGAIGGVINVTDRRINADPNDELSGGIEIRLGDSATNEESLVFSLDGGNDTWNWHIDGFSNESDDIEIPGFAESEIFHETEGHDEHDEEHDDELDEHEEEIEGLLENSFVDTKGGSIGTTYLTDWGHVGFAVSTLDITYGVPGHVHHGEEEEHNDDNDHGGEHEEEHHDEGVFIDLEQTRYDLQLVANPKSDLIEELFVGYGYTDYKHVEIEGDEVGTEFNNEAWEFKTYIKHKPLDNWHGVWGFQINERDFSAIGEEAFVPPSTTDNFALFALEEKEFENMKIELGARFEQQETSALGESISKSGMNLSSGLVYTIKAHNKIAFNYSRAARFASAEELFAFGPHLASRTFEIGNNQLDKEIANNIDISYRFETERMNGEINLYHNQFDEYIYGAPVDQDAACVNEEAEEEAEHDELQLICYQQADATFTGAEFSANIELGSIGEHHFDLGLTADIIKAEFDDGGYVPRIPPKKMGVILRHSYSDWSTDISYTSYNNQNKIAESELPTKGFDMLNLDLAYRIVNADGEWFIFLKGKNLLDEEARDHSSFLKDLAPRTGKSFMLGARYSF